MERTTYSARLLSAQSAIETSESIGPAIVTRLREVTFYATFGAGVTAGVITVEAAPFREYTGTWASLGTIAWSAASKAGTLSVTGVHLALRARISTAIVAGTVDVDFVGN